MTNAAGIVQLGDGHDSVVFENSLTDASTIASVGAGSIVETGAVFDAERGTKGGPNGSVMFTGFDYVNLETAGQFSFEIEKEAISKFNGTTGSVKQEFTADTYFLTNAAVDGSAPIGRIFMDFENILTAQVDNGGGGLMANIKHHSLSTTTYDLVTMSWDYGTNYFWINGKLIFSAARTRVYADIFKWIYLNSDRGNAGANLPQRDFYMRNFVLSSQPVMVASHPQLTNVYMWGDSFVDNADVNNASGSGFYSNNAKQVLEGYLAKKGFGVSLTVSGTGGATIWDGSGNALQTQRAGMLANNPQHVIFQAGTNDVILATLPVNYETDLDDHINTILASIPGKIFLGNPPSVKFTAATDNAERRANVAQARQIMAEAPARWDAANPSDTGRVVTYDLWAAFGGETPTTNIFGGEVTGTDNLHPSAMGQEVMGRLQGETILNTLK